jgi:hypothetical protein
MKCLQIGTLLLLLVEQADTLRTHLRHWRRIATSRDVCRPKLAGETRSRRSTRALESAHDRCLDERESDHLSGERWSFGNSSESTLGHVADASL